MPFPTNRGIKKVNERILTNGRAMIVTEKDASKYDWSEIPAGSKFIDTHTGIESVKLTDVLTDKASNTPIGYGVMKNGKVFCQDGITPIYKPDGVTQYLATEVEYRDAAGWVPANIKNDGTLCIARDSMIIEEVFIVESLNDGSGNMVYSNTEGGRRRFPKTSTGGYVFELEHGPYMRQRNHLEVTIDDCLRRTAKSGGITELTERRFSVNEELEVGQEITARYVRIFRLGNPYPRIFINNSIPEAAEIGDLWLDTDDFIDTYIGATIDAEILPDETLNAGLQPPEDHSVPNDIKASDNP